MSSLKTGVSSEDPTVYRVKRFLKTWETSYVAENHKEPSKQDIPDDIKILYKVYKRIKEEKINDVIRKKVDDLLLDLNEVYNISETIKNEKNKDERSNSIISTVRFSPVKERRKPLGPVLTRADSTPEEIDANIAVRSEKNSDALINEVVDGIMVQIKSDVPVVILPKIQAEAISDGAQDTSIQHAAELNLENAVMSKRVPMNTVLQCRVVRSRKILPIYSIKNECDGRELCRVKKVVKGYKIFTIKDGEEHFEYFIEQAKETYTAKDMDGKSMLTVVLESSVPRSVSISIYESGNLRKYANRQPKWNKESETYTLNFEGRVTEPSVKNFVFADENNKNVLLFGRTGKSDFVMDCRFPMRPDQAICSMMSVFDAVDNQ
eukprot:NODE_357_length_10221_cov_0.563130.p2 type:complete len:378 gc:universal NODE_357_length_10221_cov_0.563130:404-1537(+)